jgi:Glycine rich protein
LLAGASALAILVAAADAEAMTYTVPGMYTFVAPANGEYALEAFGASGGYSFTAPGGEGAEVAGDLFLAAGETLTLYVGGVGGSYFGYRGLGGGGGGGGSFVFESGAPLAVAGGGGGAGAGYFLTGGTGLATTAGGAV